MIRILTVFLYFSALAAADNVSPCIEQIREILILARNNSTEELSAAALGLLLYTGKSVNSLGNFDACERTLGMKYASITASQNGNTLLFEGICVPDHCTVDDLSFISDEILAFAEKAHLPNVAATVSFPAEDLSAQTFRPRDLVAVIVIGFFTFMLIFGSVVQYTTMF